MVYRNYAGHRLARRPFVSDSAMTAKPPTSVSTEMTMPAGSCLVAATQLINGHFRDILSPSA